MWPTIQPFRAYGLLHGCRSGRPSALPWAIVYLETSHGATAGVHFATSLKGLLSNKPNVADPRTRASNG
jgi:hypothetical protein